MGENTHGATTVRASKGGDSGGKWLLGAVAAAVLLGGGYWAYQNYYAPGAPQTDLAYHDGYASDPLRAAPLDSDESLAAESAALDETPAPPARTPARRAAAAADTAVPEETVGITPVNASMTADHNEVVVTAPRRPVWAATPNARRLSALYPASAVQNNREGEARLSCTVIEGGALDCVRVEATSGFGNAAMQVARSFRHAPTLADGRDATDTPVNLHVVFRMPEESRRG